MTVALKGILGAVLNACVFCNIIFQCPISYIILNFSILKTALLHINLNFRV